jgi:hypothetical protein
MGQDEQPWDTLPYHPEEITELFLGLALDNADLGEICSTARAVNPLIAVFQAKRSKDGKIDFDRVDP